MKDIIEASAIKFDDHTHLTNNTNTLNCDITTYVLNEYDRLKSQRQGVEENWLEAWALYLGTPEAVEQQRANVIKTVGEVNTDWRHKINTGKAFEAVETVHGYLMSACFPNSEWFSVIPQQPDLLDLARVVKRYTAMKFESCNFKSHFAKFLRQLLITGNSVMALPWRYETKKFKKKVKVETHNGDYLGFGEKETFKTKTESRIYKNAPAFETLDVFDCYIDGTAPVANEATFIRRIVKTRFDVIQDIKRGYYQDLEPLDVCNLSSWEADTNTKKNELRSYMGVNTARPFSMHDKVEVLEFWGDVYTDEAAYLDVCVTIIGKKMARFEPNPFWAGKPFVIGTAVELTQTPYAVGLIQPNAGLLHQLNIITNQRLDNLELAIDEMYTYVDDGVLNPEDISTEPGKVFLVGTHDSLRPIPRNTQHYTVTYQEGSVLEQSIDRNIGTGALISANNARSGERVTAAEIQAVKDAGGNRLSNLHQHIEMSSLLPILEKTYRSIQQFVNEKEVVRVAGKENGTFDYIKLSPEDFQYDFDLKPMGAQHATDRSRFIKDRIELIQTVSQIPQMAEKLNYERILTDFVQHWGFDDPDSYILQPEPPQLPQGEMPQSGVPEQMPNPQQPPTLEEALYQIGGNNYKQGFQQRVAREGIEGVVANDLGYDMTDTENIPPIEDGV